MLPLVALVGRPNVGKSTLFNCLCGSRSALVAELPGLTRDRHYGRSRCGERELMLVDTAGMLSTTGDDLSRAVQHQTRVAIEEAELVLFVVDAREGLCSEDREIATRLRRASRPWLLLVNKIDGLPSTDAIRAEFSPLGTGQMLLLSATHRRGLDALRGGLEQALPDTRDERGEEDGERAVRVAVLGRPNVGKSTLVNRLLGQERMVVGEQPGLTRDSIDISWNWGGQPCVLTDTAGIRRRSSISGEAEKDSVWMALRAMRRADVAVLMLDAAEGVTEQDLRLLGLILEGGVAVVIALNKSELLDREQRRRHLQPQLERRLRFASFVERVHISALRGTGLATLQRAVRAAEDAAGMRADTPQLNRILQEALAAHPPPLLGGRRIRLRYAHAGGRRPPLIVLHGTGAARTPANYRRYLENYFRQHLELGGSPLRLAFRNTGNPFAPAKPARPASSRGRRPARRVKKKGT